MIACITGGAKRIGREITLYIASLGYDILLHYNSSESEAIETANFVESLYSSQKHCKVELICSDFLKQNDVQNLINLIQKKNVSLLVNNASLFINDSICSPITPVNSDNMLKHMQINCNVPLLLMQAMSQSNDLFNTKKNVINLLDYSIYRIPKNFCSYSLSKFAFYKATQIAAKSCSEKLRVNAIALGQALINEMQSPKLYKQWILSSPLQCKPSMLEIINAIDFILKTPSMTGQVVNLDGGAHLVEGDL